MKIAPSLARPKEPTIALINVVFLMLVFFMIAGTLAPPLDPDLSLIKAEDLDGSSLDANANALRKNLLNLNQ